jgi:hypothetical protein
VKDQSKLSYDEMANIVEKEILPTWREGKTPDDHETNLHAYAETRERAWVEFAAALRKNDDDGIKASMKTMAEAETYGKKLQE